MRSHNICFNEEILKIIPKLSKLLLLIWSLSETINSQVRSWWPKGIKLFGRKVIYSIPENSNLLCSDLRTTQKLDKILLLVKWDVDLQLSRFLSGALFWMEFLCCIVSKTDCAKVKDVSCLPYLLAIRQGCSPFRTTQDLNQPCVILLWEFPKQPQESRSVLKDGSTFLGLFWNRKLSCSWINIACY